jgi:hypothetical protein
MMSRPDPAHPTGGRDEDRDAADARRAQLEICGEAFGLCASRRQAKPTNPKIDRIAAAIATPEGVSMLQLMLLTGWRAHSVRAAISAVLRKKRRMRVVRLRRFGVSHYFLPADRGHA